MDNKTAFSYLIKMGGTKYPVLLTLANEIWKILYQKITLTLEYLSSNLNVRAEWLFRKHVDSSDWKLDPHLFQNTTVVNDSVKHVNTRSNLASTDRIFVDKCPRGRSSTQTLKCQTVCSSTIPKAQTKISGLKSYQEILIYDKFIETGYWTYVRW